MFNKKLDERVAALEKWVAALERKVNWLERDTKITAPIQRHDGYNINDRVRIADVVSSILSFLTLKVKVTPATDHKVVVVPTVEPIRREGE